MFRTKYLDYAELTAQLGAWQKAHPDFVRITSLGKSAEGRDIPLAILSDRAYASVGAWAAASVRSPIGGA